MATGSANLDFGCPNIEEIYGNQAPQDFKLSSLANLNKKVKIGKHRKMPQSIYKKTH